MRDSAAHPQRALGIIAATFSGFFTWHPKITTIMSTAVNQSLLAAIVEIAQRAGAAIMAIYQSDYTIEHKGDDSPLTSADRAAHALICRELAALTPTIPVLSEESPAETHAPSTRHGWSTLWLVDPLDGTREFIKRNGEFTVNIALIENSRSVMGVVAAPALKLTYFGASGLGAWRLDESGAEPVTQAIQVRHLPARPVVVGSRSHRGDSLDTLLARLGAHDFQSVGSALKFCRVAEAQADLYPRLGPTSEWDTAAGQAVLEAAGGQVLNLDGTPLRYNRRETLLNPFFMALGDAAYHWQRLL